MIAPLGVEASLKAIEELSAGDTAQRAALSRKLEQLEYEARAFEQYDVVDARNRLAAAELERRWNEKLEEIRDCQRATFRSRRKALFAVIRRRGQTFFRWERTSPKPGITAVALPLSKNDLPYRHGRNHRSCGFHEERRCSSRFIGKEACIRNLRWSGLVPQPRPQHPWRR